MAIHQSPCSLCAELEECRAGTHPRLIAEMETGFAVLGPHQYFPGYALLICSEPATELDELQTIFRWQFLQDMAKLAAAIGRAVQPHKLNYESLGNQVHHLHWHIFPRHLDETGAKDPVWLVMPSGDEMTPYLFDPERHAETILAIRSQI